MCSGSEASLNSRLESNKEKKEKRNGGGGRTGSSSSSERGGMSVNASFEAVVFFITYSIAACPPANEELTNPRTIVD